MAQEKRGPGRPRKVKEEGMEQDDSQQGTGEEELEEGKDPSVLFADSIEHKLELNYKGQKWTFQYRDMTWGENNECIDAAQIWEQGDFRFSISKYYVMALQKMLIRSPVRPITETTLMKLNREIGEALQSIVPNPVEQGEVEAIKKV
jgi:hypothetical protein